MTVTTSGAAKAVVMPVDWPLPEVTARVNPLDSKAPMSTAPEVGRGRPPLVGGDAALGRCARADGGAAGQKRHGLGRSAVVAEWRPGPGRRGWSGRCCRSVPLIEPPEPPVPIRLLSPGAVDGSADVAAHRPGPVFPATIVSFSVAVPTVVQAAAGRTAELPLTVQLVSVVVPWRCVQAAAVARRSCR